MIKCINGTRGMFKFRILTAFARFYIIFLNEVMEYSHNYRNIFQITTLHNRVFNSCKSEMHKGITF